MNRSSCCAVIEVVVCATVSLSCGGPPAPKPGEPVTIVFKHAKHPQYEVLGSLIKQFELEHPGIRVREEILPAASDDQRQFYVINLAGGADDFDVIDMDIIWVPEFARAGWLAPLTAEVTDAELEPLLDQALLPDWRGDELYGLPWFVDVGVLYYRSDLLDKYGFDPPGTYEELRRQAIHMLNSEGSDQLTGFVWQGMQYEGLVCTALEFIRGNGGDVLAGDTARALLREETLEALNYMQGLIGRDGVTPAIITTMSEEPARRLFQAGRAIFMRNWPYAWPLLNAPGSPVAGHVGLALVPHFAGHESGPTLGGYHLGVNARSRHRREASQFVRFMVRYASQKQIALRMARLPAHAAVYRDPDVAAAMPYLAELVPALERARPRPITPYYFMMSQILQPELSAIVARIRSPEEAMSLAARQVERLMDEP